MCSYDYVSLPWLELKEGEIDRPSADRQLASFFVCCWPAEILPFYQDYMCACKVCVCDCGGGGGGGVCMYRELKKGE